MKAIAAILLLAMTGAALAETGKPADQPITVYKDGKPFIFDGMRRRLPSGFRSDVQKTPPDATQDAPDNANKPAPVKALHRAG